MIYSLSRVLLLPILPIVLAGVISAQKPAEPGSSSEPIHQLRVYEIFDNNKQAFHERFRDHATRIMKRYDFNIVAIWESKKDGRTDFVYLIQWPDTATMKDRWAKFMADKEWAGIKKETAAKSGQMVGDIADRTLILTDFSPRKSLLK